MELKISLFGLRGQFVGLGTSVADPDPSDPYGLGLLDPDPDPLVRGMDPAPDGSFYDQAKIVRKTWIPTAL
jgi:hypothetical protein